MKNMYRNEHGALVTSQRGRDKLSITLGILAMVIAFAQSPAQTPSKPSFQVASVKRNANSGFSPTTLGMIGNRFSATGMPLRPLIMQIYNLRDFQIVGGPDWVNIDQWDFEAVAEDGAKLSLLDPEHPDQPTPGSLMVQSLIESRFRFTSHRERRELPVYELLVAKNGPKIKLSTDRNSLTRRIGRGEIEIQGYPFAYFAYLLARQLDHVLIDKTNMTRPYDIKLQWNTELRAGAEPSDRPSIFSAIQDQLGLKLESAKGPVDVLVIDSVEKPSEN